MSCIAKTQEGVHDLIFSILTRNFRVLRKTEAGNSHCSGSSAKSCLYAGIPFALILNAPLPTTNAMLTGAHLTHMYLHLRMLGFWLTIASDSEFRMQVLPYGSKHLGMHL